MDNTKIALRAGIFGMAIMSAIWVGGTHLPWYGVVIVALIAGVVFDIVTDAWHKLWRK